MLISSGRGPSVRSMQALLTSEVVTPSAQQRATQIKSPAKRHQTCLPAFMERVKCVLGNQSGHSESPLHQKVCLEIKLCIAALKSVQILRRAT